MSLGFSSKAELEKAERLAKILNLKVLRGQLKAEAEFYGLDKYGGQVWCRGKRSFGTAWVFPLSFSIS